MKAIVVGAGIVGLSTAWALRKMGHDVAVNEQGPAPNPEGSSFDRHRLIRYPYGSSAGYARMVRDAYRAWELLWQDLGETLYAQTGTLVVRRTRDGWSTASAAALADLGIEFNALEPAECEAKFPHIRWANTLGAYHLNSGGLLFADKIVSALTQRVRRMGVELRPRSTVASVDVERTAVRFADGSAADADAVVVAAGAWLLKLFPELSDALKPSRQIVAYLEPPGDRVQAWAASPMILDLDQDPAVYVAPPARETGLKVGDHRFTGRGDPADARGASAAEATDVLRKCERLFSDHGGYRVEAARDCYYAVAADERFVVKCIGQTWIVSACSGHGFKFGAVIGRAVADAVAGARRADEVAEWAAGMR